MHLYKPKEKILVCGGRDFHDRYFVFSQLDLYRRWFASVFLVMQGEADGVDRLAKQWAKREGMPCVGMEANWDFYGLGAGHIRNDWMAEWLTPDLVLAFPGGRGTADMIKIAKRRKIDYHIIIKTGSA